MYQIYSKISMEVQGQDILFCHYEIKEFIKM